MAFPAVSRTCWKVPLRLYRASMGQFLINPSKDKQLDPVEPDQAVSSGALC